MVYNGDFRIDFANEPKVGREKKLTTTTKHMRKQRLTVSKT